MPPLHLLRCCCCTVKSLILCSSLLSHLLRFSGLLDLTPVSLLESLFRGDLQVFRPLKTRCFALSFGTMATESRLEPAQQVKCPEKTPIQLIHIRLSSRFQQVDAVVGHGHGRSPRKTRRRRRATPLEGLVKQLLTSLASPHSPPSPPTASLARLTSCQHPVSSPVSGSVMTGLMEGCQAITLL